MTSVVVSEMHFARFRLASNSMLSVWLVAALGTSFGAAPSELSGLLYAEYANLAAPGGIRSRSRNEVLLRADGIAQGLFESFERASPVPATAQGIPPNASWSYRKLDEIRGVLLIGGNEKTLTFTTDRSGSVDPPGALTSRQFELLAYEPSKVVNCSNRSFVRAGGAAFIGFVVNGSGRNRVLVRAIGEGLYRFGISDPLSRPSLTIVRSGGTAALGASSGWEGSASIAEVSARAGAFDLEPRSSDAAVYVSLEAGAYVAEVSSLDATASGQVLIEVYVLP